MNRIINNYYFHVIIILFILILLNFPHQNIKNLTLIKLCRHNYYKIKEFDPTEDSEGKIYFTCGLCGNNKTEEIPKLNEDNYFIEQLEANCEHGSGKRFISKQYKNRKYEITNDIKYNHSIYGSKCKVCHKNIGEFDFHRLSEFNCYTYPRLYRLSEYWNYTWLLGGDNGTILCHRSSNEGLTWSEPSIVSNFPSYICSNVDFFELPNHNIICSYRAIGNSSIKRFNIRYNRKIFSSISKDGGKTWKNLGLIIDNFILAKRLGKTINEAIEAIKNYNEAGFFEPFVQYFNNKITVLYADDFTSSLLLLAGSIDDSKREQSLYSHTFDLSTNKWSKKRNIIMNGFIKKSPTKSGLNKRISRDGMPVTDVMKDGTYVMVFEGTYRRKKYVYFTGGELDEYHPFEIVISYSKDGINWSNPIEVYNGHNKNSKYSAPYICITDSDQLIISFQTDEDSVNSGFIGDLYSIMKVMISKPGISIDKIDKDSFFSVVNNYNSPIGGSSLWNGMMLIGNIIYTCSSGHPILYSELPLFDEPNKYKVILKNKYYIVNGDAEFFGNKIITKGKDNIIINKEYILNSTINIYTKIIPNITGECGLILGINDYFEKINNYYAFIINNEGILSFQNRTKNETKNLYSNKNLIHINYNKENVYKMSIKYNYSTNEIAAYINELDVFKITNKYFLNSFVGFLSSNCGTIFTQLMSE